MESKKKNNRPAGRLCLFFGATLTLQVLSAGLVFCNQNIDIEKLADAIKKSENSINHPYGILKKYCKPHDPDGQCRKGCVQTIEHALKDWDGEIDFISFLGGRYAPIGTANDPKGLNRNWIKNVKNFYDGGKK